MHIYIYIISCEVSILNEVNCSWKSLFKMGEGVMEMAMNSSQYSKILVQFFPEMI